MNSYKLLLLIIVGYNLAIHGVERDKLPHSKLDSATIEWWFPTYINPPKLHTTLTVFEIGDIWKNITNFTPLEIKKDVGRRYAQIKNALINAQATILSNQNFAALFPRDETYSLSTIDIISTHPDFANDFILDSSALNPSGIQQKLINFKKIIEDGTAFEKEWITTRKGQEEVPKYRWFLVVKLDNSFINFRNKLCSNKLFSPFPQSQKFTYLPHITLGRIESIENFNVFMSLIKLINTQISNEPIGYRSFRLSAIDRNLSNQVLQLKSQKLNYINWFQANENKTYFLLDSTKNNLIFMVVIGWDTSTGKFLNNLVRILPDQEKTAKEEVLKSSINSLSQLYSSLISLETQWKFVR